LILFPRSPECWDDKPDSNIHMYITHVCVCIDLNPHSCHFSFSPKTQVILTISLTLIKISGIFNHSPCLFF
jgi:hypothetical protein